MQLRVARLCLDCEEVHDRHQCPRCASESVAFLSLWVPAPERRTRPRDVAPVSQGPGPASEAKGRNVAYGVIGLALAGVAGLWWTGRQKIEAAAENSGELQ